MDEMIKLKKITILEATGYRLCQVPVVNTFVLSTNHTDYHNSLGQIHLLAKWKYLLINVKQKKCNTEKTGK